MFLKIDRLNKSFASKKIVDNLSFSVNKGELLCILGPSGCGKTTTLRMIGGFLEPDGGRIYIDDKDYTDINAENRPVSTVFQSYALFPHMNVIENVIYGLKFKGFSKKEALKKGEEYLQLVELLDQKDKKISDISGGQQQRVALARALIVSPKVLLLDEPLSNLDAKLRVSMRDEIKRIQDKFNITMVFVTHDQEEALSIADKVLILNEGRLEQIGPPTEVYNRPKNDFVLRFIGDCNILREDKETIEYVRPENIDIVTDGGIEGIISQVNFLGSDIEYVVKTRENSLRLHLQNNVEKILNQGDKINLSYKKNIVKKTE